MIVLIIYILLWQTARYRRGKSKRRSSASANGPWTNRQKNERIQGHAFESTIGKSVTSRFFGSRSSFIHLFRAHRGILLERFIQHSQHFYAAESEARSRFFPDQRVTRDPIVVLLFVIAMTIFYAGIRAHRRSKVCFFLFSNFYQSIPRSEL